MEEINENTLKNLKEKFKNEETAFDSVDVEKSLREFKTELYIKRDQVKQLRNDLDIAATETKELKKALDASNKTLDEKNFNLNVLTKKFRITEDELVEKINALNTIQMQHKLTVAELEKIKEILQKNEVEKTELSRKLEVFQTKQRQSFIYHNQILKKETNLKSTIEEIQEMMEKLKSEQHEVAELSRKTKIATDSIEKFQQLSLNYKKIKKEKDHFEDLYIKINAKCETLEELLNSKEDLQEPNLVNKIIFNQWKLNRKHYEQQLEENNEILNKLSECYSNEKLVNVQLILKNEQVTEECQNIKIKLDQLVEDHRKEMENYKQKIMKLEEKLQQIENKTGNVDENKTGNVDEKIEIKDEPIEIIDD